MRIRAVLVATLVVLVLSAADGRSGAAATTHVGDRWNGKTVAVTTGDVVVATLGSTYWAFGPTPSNLTALGPAVARPGGPSCPRFPGSGCGTVTKRFRAVRIGSGALTAARTTCGEALQCTRGAGRWRVTVRVRPASTRAILVGHVTSSPSCPVERADQPCPPRPVAGNVQALRSGRIVASAATDASGRYELSLAPATYDLRVDVHGTFPRCPTRTVAARAGRQVIDFDCESGIR